MKGWRTLGLNLAITGFGVLEATDWTAVIGNKNAGLALAAIGVANIIVRTLTSTPVGQKG